MKPGHPFSKVLWGGISGALAAWLTTPFDVIKTRVMTANELMTFSQAMRSGCGAVGLLAGAGPRSAWWFCVSSVFFGTYERLRSSFQEKLESWHEVALACLLLNLAKRSDKRVRFGAAAWTNGDHGSPHQFTVPQNDSSISFLDPLHSNFDWCFRLVGCNFRHGPPRT